MDRHPIPQENYRILKIRQLIQLIQRILHALGTLFFYYFKLSALKTVKSGINLIPSCIHDGTDDSLRSVQLKSQAVHGRDRNNRLVQSQAEPFYCCCPDPKPGKRARPHGCCNSIQFRQLKSHLFSHHIQHGKQRL